MIDNDESRTQVFLKTKGLKKSLYRYSQSEIFNSLPGFDRNSERQLSMLFKNSSISNRYSIFENLLDSEIGEFSFEKISRLSTTERNDLYRQYAPKLFFDASRELIEEIDNFEVKKITHLITVSCTGCYSPGPGEELMKSLNLENNVERLHVGYMGCYAGLAAIRIANSISRAEKNAVILIVCVELSSLHWRDDTSDDNKLSLSLFSDGASAAIVSQNRFAKSFLIKNVSSELIPDTEKEMAWHMGERGFEMTLSRDVPHLLEMNIMESVLNFISPINMTLENIDYWAVHPGGSKILKLLEDKFMIQDKIKSSWNILDQFGNMSSSTIMYVLEDILRKAQSNSKVISLAFGPGLTVEKAFFGVS
jgi:alpha-pyrone synthase